MNQDTIRQEKQKRVEKQLFQIAQDNFGVTTLEARNQDCLDHHDVSVWGIKQALQDAYKLGQKDNN